MCNTEAVLANAKSVRTTPPLPLRALPVIATVTLASTGGAAADASPATLLRLLGGVPVRHATLACRVSRSWCADCVHCCAASVHESAYHMPAVQRANNHRLQYTLACWPKRCPHASLRAKRAHEHSLAPTPSTSASASASARANAGTHRRVAQLRHSCCCNCCFAPCRAGNCAGAQGCWEVLQVREGADWHVCADKSARKQRLGASVPPNDSERAS